MNIIFLILLTLSFSEIHIDNNLFVEKQSGRNFTVEVNYNVDSVNINIKSGVFTYTENLIKRADTLFIISRNIKYGLLSGSTFYEPLRPRIVFPVLNSDTLYYNGIEHIAGLKREVKSYVFSVCDSNKMYTIKNVTIRNDKADEYEIHIDSTGLIKYISMDLPMFSFVAKMIGLKDSKLEFVPYDEYRQ